MKKIKTGILLVIIVGMSSCIPSLHPLYTKETKSIVHQAEGLWFEKDGKDYWEIKRSILGDGKSYTIKIGDTINDLNLRFMLTFVELNGSLYADFYPMDYWDKFLMRSDYLATHFFGRVEFNSNNMTFYYPDVDQLQKLFREGKIRLKHEILDDNDDEILITASTPELQEFMSKYGNNDNLFSLGQNFTRQ